MDAEKYIMMSALTRYNYFPNQKSNIGELPPIVNSRTFTPEVAIEISKERYRFDGYDVVTYLATRFNNAPRELSLIHPKAYADLVNHIVTHWDKIKHIEENPNSIIRPEIHHDGRVFIMNYGDPVEKAERSMLNSFGKKFLVKTDISNCFNSIYTHAISWGLVTIPKAKKESGREHSDKWFNKYDKLQRNCKRNETQGVPIGPGTSNIALECMLFEIDKILRENNFDFYRYVDDYECFCKDDNEAHLFIKTLRDELYKYKFFLSSHKTEIIKLPAPYGEEWIMELTTALPRRLHNASENEPELSSYEAIDFINKAIHINNAYPDGSVLKFALQTIMPFISDDAAHSLYKQTLTLSWHYPILIPYLEKLIEKSALPTSSFEGDINKLIVENCSMNRSDGISWPLYILYKFGGELSDTAMQAILKSNDGVSMALLYHTAQDISQLIDFAKGIVDSEDLYLKDSQWLLLYELFKDGVIENPYPQEGKVFEILKDNDVSFILTEDSPLTKAENKSEAMYDSLVFDDLF